MEKMNKIRELLGSNYYLCESYTSINYEWKLFRKYDDPVVYYSADNKPVMTSEENTIDELYEFAETHHRINEHRQMGKMTIHIAIIICIACMINVFFFQSKVIHGFILGVDLILFVYSYVAHKIYCNNLDIDLLESYEMYKKSVENKDNETDKETNS